MPRLSLKAISKIVNDFEKASVALSWKGSQMPETHDRITSNYYRTKEKLIELLKSGEYPNIEKESSNAVEG